MKRRRNSPMSSAQKRFARETGLPADVVKWLMAPNGALRRHYYLAHGRATKRDVAEFRARMRRAPVYQENPLLATVALNNRPAYRENPVAFTGPALTIAPFSPFGKVFLDFFGVGWRGNSKKNPPMPRSFKLGASMSPSTWAYLVLEIVWVGLRAKSHDRLAELQGFGYGLSRPAVFVDKESVISLIPRIDISSEIPDLTSKHAHRGRRGKGPRKTRETSERAYERWKRLTRSYNLERKDVYVDTPPTVFAFDLWLALDMAWVILGPPHPAEMFSPGSGFGRAAMLLGNALDRALQTGDQTLIDAVNAAALFEQRVQGEERQTEEVSEELIQARKTAIQEGLEPEIEAPLPESYGKKGYRLAEIRPLRVTTEPIPAPLVREAAGGGRRDAMREARWYSALPSYEAVTWPQGTASAGGAPPAPYRSPLVMIRKAAARMRTEEAPPQWRKRTPELLAARAQAEAEKRAFEEAAKAERQRELMEEKRAFAVATGARPPVPSPAPELSAEIVQLVRENMRRLVAEHGSQAAAASALGISSPYFSMLVSNRSPVTFAVARRVLGHVGMAAEASQVPEPIIGAIPRAEFGPWRESLRALLVRHKTKDLALAWGVSQGYVHAILKGRFVPKPEIQRAILDMAQRELPQAGANPRSSRAAVEAFRSKLPKRKRNRDSKWKEPPPAKELDLSEIEDMEGYQRAVKKFRRFHGTNPNKGGVVRIDDGKHGVTRKGPYVALGHRVETIYQTPSPGMGGWSSNKNENPEQPTIWFHEHAEDSPPMILLDPETGLTMDVGGKYLVDDWYYS